MSERKKKISVLDASLLLTGNMIGAGILALPIKAGLAGVAPNLMAISVVWVFMTLTAWIIAKMALSTHQDTLDLPSMFERLFGPVGKWLAAGANLFILYGMLVAYLGGMSSVVHAFLPLSHSQALSLAFVVATLLTVFGIRFVSRFNSLLMIALWGAFFVLVFMCAKNMNFANVSYQNLKFIPYSIPCIVAGFHFHNVIPSVCEALSWEESSIFRAIMWGAIAGLLMNLVWVYVALGALPFNGEGEGNLLFAFIHQQPATIPLSKYLSSSVITMAGQIFALVAILTSFMSNGLALRHFLKDFLLGTFGRSRQWLEWILALGVPLLIVYLNPELFLKTIDAVGGIGMVIIFGILPGLFASKCLSCFPKYKSMGRSVTLFFWLVLIGDLIYMFKTPILENVLR